MRIFLWGYMGSGKSTVGKALADRLQLPFIDLDNRIEEQTGMRVEEFFNLKGEAQFRIWEARTCMECIALSANFVMACGGGTPLQPELAHAMKSAGLSVYLKVPASELKRRLHAEVQLRPLIKGVPQSEMGSFIATHLAQREPVYGQAHCTVDGARSVDEVVESIALLVHSR